MVSSVCEQDHPYVDIIGNIRHGLSLYGGIELSHISRDFNLVADWLARAPLLLLFGVHVFPSPFDGCHWLLRIDVGEDLSSWPFEPGA